MQPPVAAEEKKQDQWSRDEQTQEVKQRKCIGFTFEQHNKQRE